ncbi:hypothetical protein Cgig2_013150 [Carnegiea gigantea]|uniref:Cytochrome P450 n=1 Tax=Carnegiea gigantea TaxID=171969 RepID=A0A9Q1QLQ4_9CARY|nr:hypothetical protein Cgig2_013150 [Carnegiea gigantea]
MTNEALQYKNRKTPNEDVLGTLLKLVKEDQLTLDDVKHLLLVNFLCFSTVLLELASGLVHSGTDTTAITLEWAMTELLRHSEKITQAPAEIGQVLSQARFLDGEIDLKGRNFELMPFGTGRRMCPGMPLAPRMVHPMFATLLHSVTSSHLTP